ncbi:DUF87 domain-containing protein [Virgibacillus sp. LDC1]|nr:DUF87 domain-containing protein [Virgibacillus sp. LDC1]
MNNITDFDYLRNLTVGTVEFVSPLEIKVLLEMNTPHSTAFNAGFPVSFPKINGFVIVPNEAGAIVGTISWIGIENSIYPKRNGLKDFDLIDLPFPQRKMSVSLLGTLKFKRNDCFEFERGVYQFPSVGDVVAIPTKEQMEAIIENREENARVIIGTAPVAGNAPVKINPDILFGRHIAVLGNTGSGKSCSVAGLINWSIGAAKKDKNNEKPLNARFIVLDPNGEYFNTFDHIGKVRKFKVNLDQELIEIASQLKVPAWMWNSYEWSSIVQASGKLQRPILRRALRELRNGETKEDKLSSLNRMLISYNTSLLGDLKAGAKVLAEFPGKRNLGEKILTLKDELNNFKDEEYVEPNLRTKMDSLLISINSILERRYAPYPDKSDTTKMISNFKNFNSAEIEDLIKEIKEVTSIFKENLKYKGLNEDTPISFDISNLSVHIEQISIEQNALHFLDFLIMRIQTMLADAKMTSIINHHEEITLEQWLGEYIGDDGGRNGEIVVIDLSLVPSDIIHLVVAVMSRIIFESLQRYRRQRQESLPTVLVLEEAHNFITRYSHNTEEISPAIMCTQVFERIAKEGRKFGLGLMLSSQRPSELSSTVLSQCNTFLLHRIVNDRDQELVKRLVPDNLGAMLNELPVLMTGKAILIGAASSIPVLVEMKRLSNKERPQSSDPDFWNVWTGRSKREIDWSGIAKEWQEE